MDEILLEEAIEEELKPLVNKEIFEHGYPEARMIPSDHYEKCLEEFKEELKEKVNDAIDNIVHDLYF